MSEAQITPEVLAAASTVEEDGPLIEDFDGGPCGTCGEPFEAGQQVLMVRAPEFDRGYARAVEDIHLRCYQGEEVRRYD